ncbi:surface lipoprotein assembly modifier [Thauera sp. Sel9]|uniref:surface lipoprotein assembly modifier n=1 Tax=Thauera sp. Sel9 TaxID=2974299 RepID=UPI0021E16A7E|nr:surface lipoprotein assembly modifier [Thauera sp. Sel9]
MLHRVIIAPFLLISLVSTGVHADDDDTRRLLHQIDRGVMERERSHLVDETPLPGMGQGSLITIGETTYLVQDTLEDLKPAIYVAMNLRQWAKVGQFVEKYGQLPGHDEGLVLLAEGMLAREVRNYGEASAKLRSALERDPDNVRAKLELARVYFEDNQSYESRMLFDQISISGIPDEVRPVIEGFQGALRERDSWNGSLSLGVGYNSNINQANGMVTVSEYCLPPFGCFPSIRRMPEPIQSSSFVYDLTLNRRLQLAGHHNAQLRGISYGKFYRQHKEVSEDSSAVHYGESTSIVYAGYNYLSALDDVLIAPLFEHNYGNRHSRYQAVGLRVEWKHNLTARTQLGATAQRKHVSFKAQERQYFDDYDENQFGVFASYMLGDRTAIYGGLNHTRQQHSQPTASNREYMANLGIYHVFETGFNVNATALYRRLRHDAADAFLGGQRKDRQQVYIVNIGMPRFAFKGITPNLYLKRTVNDSNIDWAYEYRQTEVALKLEKSF